MAPKRQWGNLRRTPAETEDQAKNHVLNDENLVYIYMLIGYCAATVGLRDNLAI